MKKSRSLYNHSLNSTRNLKNWKIWLLRMLENSKNQILNNFLLKKIGEYNILYTSHTRQYVEQIGRKNTTVRTSTGTPKNFSITAVTSSRRLGSRRPTLTTCTFIPSTPPHHRFASRFIILLLLLWCGYGVSR